LFLFSDGVTDQFGGPQGRKLGSKQLKSLFSDSSHLALTDQGEHFSRKFYDWKGDRKQIDGVLLVGISC